MSIAQDLAAPPAAALAGKRRGAVVILSVLLLTVVVSVLGLGVGSHPVEPGIALQAVFAYDPTQNEHLIVISSRLPRIVLGLIAGVALGVSGALIQSVTRNPLGDPGILGLNAGASLLVCVAIAFLGITSVKGYLVFALLGAALAAGAVHLLGASRGAAATGARIALAGTALSLVLGALTQMILLGNEGAFASFRFWAVGSLQGRGLETSAAVLPLVVAGLLFAYALSGPLDNLVLGDATARALGTRAGSVRALAILAAVLLAGAATAAAGPIGFVGLAAAHLARRVVGSAHRWLIPASAVFGAACLVCADALGRWLVAPAELQTGIATALFGAPVFIAVVRSRSAGV